MVTMIIIINDHDVDDNDYYNCNDDDAYNDHYNG